MRRGHIRAVGPSEKPRCKHSWTLRQPWQPGITPVCHMLWRCGLEIAASLGGDAYGQRNRAHGYGRILALDADHSALTVGIAVGYSGERRLAD